MKKEMKKEITTNCIRIAFEVDIDIDQKCIKSDVRYEPDVFCIPLGDDGMIPSNDDLVFFNNSSNTNKSIYHYGDAVGCWGCSNCGDDSIAIDFSRIPSNYKTIHVIVHLSQAEERGICFDHSKSKIYVVKIPSLSNCKGETITEHSFSLNEKGCCTIELCRFSHINDCWEIQFPSDAGIVCDFVEYLKSLGVTI